MDDRARQHLQTLYRALNMATVTLAGTPVSPERADEALQALEGINERLAALLRNERAFRADLAVEFARLEGQVARVVSSALENRADSRDMTKSMTNERT